MYLNRIESEQSYRALANFCCDLAKNSPDCFYRGQLEALVSFRHHLCHSFGGSAVLRLVRYTMVRLGAPHPRVST